MPKVLVISDSHGYTEEISQIAERHREEVDQMLHCGDSELDAEAAELEGFMKVGGNMDFDPRFPDETTFTVGEITFFAAHGHLHHVKNSLMQLSYRAQEEGAQIICFGHTHIAGAEKAGDQIFLNPGSIRLPRQRNIKTYAIVSWETKEKIDIHFYDFTGGPVSELAYSASLS